MKSIRISFRLDPYQLARGLQTIRQLEPEYKLLSTNDVVKTIYHDYIAKMSLNKNENIPLELITEITSFINNPSTSKNLSLDELINIKSDEPTKIEPIVDFDNPEIHEEDITDKILAEVESLSNNTTASKFDDPNQTESDISSVTDFTPPKEWTE